MAKHTRFLLAIVCLYSSAAFAGTFPLTGHVLDPQGVAVKDAQVLLVNAGGTQIKQATTDAKGSFELHGIPAGQYQLTAQSPSFVTAAISVPIGSGQATEVTL